MIRQLEIQYPDSNGVIRFRSPTGPAQFEQWPYGTFDEAEADGWKFVQISAAKGMHGYHTLVVEKPDGPRECHTPVVE